VEEILLRKRERWWQVLRWAGRLAFAECKEKKWLLNKVLVKNTGCEIWDIESSFLV
jgi:hypothetical protein